MRSRSVNRKDVLWAIPLALLIVHLAWAQLSVTLTSPPNKSEFSACSDILLHAEPSLPSDQVKYVTFLRNGVSLYSDTKTPYEYTWKKVPPGYYALTAKVTDKQNNVAFSDTVWINVGNTKPGNLIANWDFACGTPSPWSLNFSQQGNATMEIVSDADLVDSTTLKVNIINPSDTDWHIQLHQPFPVKAGHTYTLEFAAFAEQPRPITFEVQMNQDPWTIYFMQNETIDYVGFYGPYVFECTVDDPGAYFRFNLGANTAAFYVDKVEFVDPTMVADVEESSPSVKIPEKPILSQNYPNPFNGMTTITYWLPKQAQTTLDIYNLQGQKICTLVNSTLPPGQHTVTWNATDENGTQVPSGIYLYQIHALGNDHQVYTEQKKILFVK